MEENEDENERLGYDPIGGIEAGCAIHHEVTFGNTIDEYDDRRWREGICAWLTGAICIVQAHLGEDKSAPGMHLLAELEDLDRGRSSPLLQARFEEEWDLKMAADLGLEPSELPPRNTKRAGAPGKGIAENARIGTAAAIAQVLSDRKWNEPGMILDYVCGRLGLDQKRFRSLKNRLNAAHGRGRPVRDKGAYSVYRDVREQLRESPVEEVLARLERLAALTGAAIK